MYFDYDQAAPLAQSGLTKVPTVENARGACATAAFVRTSRRHSKSGVAPVPAASNGKWTMAALVCLLSSEWALAILC